MGKGYKKNTNAKRQDLCNFVTSRSRKNTKQENESTAKRLHECYDQTPNLAPPIEIVNKSVFAPSSNDLLAF